MFLKIDLLSVLDITFNHKDLAKLNMGEIAFAFWDLFYGILYPMRQNQLNLWLNLNYLLRIGVMTSVHTIKILFHI